MPSTRELTRRVGGLRGPLWPTAGGAKEESRSRNLTWVMPAEGMPMETSVERTTDDAFLKIEARGVEAVPPARRHGLPRHLAFLWAGAMANYASILTASLLT